MRGAGPRHSVRYPTPCIHYPASYKSFVSSWFKITLPNLRVLRTEASVVILKNGNVIIEAFLSFDHCLGNDFLNWFDRFNADQFLVEPSIEIREAVGIET